MNLGEDISGGRCLRVEDEAKAAFKMRLFGRHPVRPLSVLPSSSPSPCFRSASIMLFLFLTQHTKMILDYHNGIQFLPIMDYNSIWD